MNDLFLVQQLRVKQQKLFEQTNPFHPHTHSLSHTHAFSHSHSTHLFLFVFMDPASKASCDLWVFGVQGLVGEVATGSELLLEMKVLSPRSDGGRWVWDVENSASSFSLATASCHRNININIYILVIKISDKLFTYKIKLFVMVLFIIVTRIIYRIKI